MIDEVRTFKRFKYFSTDLTHGSTKKVYVVCDGCGKSRWQRFNNHGNFCMSCSKTGIVVSKETREKLRISSTGKLHTEETKQKLRELNLDKIVSEGTRQKIRDANIGKCHSAETILKMKASHSNKNNPNYGKFGNDSPNWKGGRGLASRKNRSKRSKFLDTNPIELNKDFKECNGHHVNQKYIINIPVELHRSIYHRQSDGMGMHSINKIAFEYLLENKENMTVSIESAYYINLMCL